MSEFENLSPDEKLKAENDFLKMKMMLENGASFGSIEGGDLPAEIENQFLRNVMAFEKQFAQQSTTTVFDKIGKPNHFKPVNDIPDADMDVAWDELDNYMQEHGVSLDVISPNISSRELYRFTTEELFDHELDDMDLPGWSSNFIYDEFYPDYKYDNTRCAVENYIMPILSNVPHDYWPMFDQPIRINEIEALTTQDFTKIISNFKAGFDVIELHDAVANAVEIEETECIVSGNYNATFKKEHEVKKIENNWKINFHFDDNKGDYSIADIVIYGIDF